MALTGQNELTGFLIIDKPAGKTSHDICVIVKRMLNVSKTSHSMMPATHVN